MSVEDSDLKLVERVQRGERAAFDLLVLRYQHKVLKLIMRYVHDATEAEDIAQEAFVKAYRALQSFRGDSAFYTWLYRIAINTAKNALVATKRRPMDYDLDLQDPEQYDLHARLAESETPEGLLLTDEIRDTGWDYLALGHQHVQSNVSQGGVTAYYAGAPGTVLRIDFSVEDGIRVEPRPLD